jgi:hypothetical protein
MRMPVRVAVRRGRFNGTTVAPIDISSTKGFRDAVK